MPHSSSGCRRCASYGSKEQRRTKAEHLALAIDNHARLVEALEFYANPKNHVQQGLPGGESASHIEFDQGQRARAALYHLGIEVS